MAEPNQNPLAEFGAEPAAPAVPANPLAEFGAVPAPAGELEQKLPEQPTGPWAWAARHLPEGSESALAAAKKYAVDPFEYLAGKGQEYGRSAAEAAVAAQTMAEHLPEGAEYLGTQLVPGGPRNVAAPEAFAKHVAK